ncbi:Uncharacterised protein [Mycobacteroides abscessus subsp. abscessus]|nr:Uncharacterised protein [Mycobacteroides abscessus subsp. abscessus]
MRRMFICPHHNVACTGSTSTTMAASAALARPSRLSARTPANRRMRHAMSASAESERINSIHFATSKDAHASGARTNVAKGG